MVCYFTDIKHIFAYLHYGPIICTVTLPEGETPIYCPESMIQDGPEIHGWYATKVILGEPQVINLDVIKSLIEKGADSRVDEYNLILWAFRYNYDVYNYLKELRNENSPLIDQDLFDYIDNGWL